MYNTIAATRKKWRLANNLVLGPSLATNMRMHVGSRLVVNDARANRWFVNVRREIGIIRRKGGKGPKLHAQARPPVGNLAEY